MNYAVILSGGIGTRMHMGDFPKQYYKVKGRMILEYTLDSFESAEAVDRIVIVMAPAWRENLEKELRGTTEIAYVAGMKICMIEGDPINFKITHPADLQRFQSIVG